MRDQFNLRLGELHVIKAHLLCLGSFVLGSGYELVWNEAGVYGPTTTRAILNASHIRRGMQAHEDNLIALMQLLVEELYKENPLLEDDVREAARGFSTDEDAEHQDVHQHLIALNLQSHIETFVEGLKGNSNARFAVQYMEMVLRGQMFLFASRNRDWLGHLQASEEICCDLFSQDRVKYMRMMPFYIASQYALQESDPDTWRALQEGDFCVTKSDLPFVSLEVDHAGEQENKVLKVDGGITGIANNANTRNRYCITAPIISRMVAEMKEHVSCPTVEHHKHHQLVPSQI